MVSLPPGRAEVRGQGPQRLDPVLVGGSRAAVAAGSLRSDRHVFCDPNSNAWSRRPRRLASAAVAMETALPGKVLIRRQLKTVPEGWPGRGPVIYGLCPHRRSALIALAAPKVVFSRRLRPAVGASKRRNAGRNLCRLHVLPPPRCQNPPEAVLMLPRQV